jgi:hypothetical protein
MKDSLGLMMPLIVEELVCMERRALSNLLTLGRLVSWTR